MAPRHWGKWHSTLERINDVEEGEHAHQYHAICRIDDDRWAKYPFELTIYDENNNIVVSAGPYRDRDRFYPFLREYGIDWADIENEFY